MLASPIFEKPMISLGQIDGYLLTLAVFLTTFLPSFSLAQDTSQTVYQIGSPTLLELWVDPVHGSDSNDGRARSTPFRTLTAAWNTIPQGVELSSTGYRINLLPGDYPESSIPNYLEDRLGTASHPVIISAADGVGTARLRGDLNVNNVRYMYLINFSVSPSPAGDALHFERADHLLIRGMNVDGGALRGAHETIKINQSQYVYIEDSDIWGSFENAIDFVAVQFGHIVRNKIHDADDWCIYLKGGSAYFVVEANEIYNCGTGGFTAGQGTGFEYMTSPWLHYEAYDIKVINNLIHHTEGAGLGVNGGYNILMAHNTLYRVGSRSHTIEVVFGLRTCDGDAAACSANRDAGGWGPGTTGPEEPIGNRNVSILNNLIYNPAGNASQYQQLAIYGPRSANAGTNIPSPVHTDIGLQIEGNLFWNGNAPLPVGVEDSDQGCQAGNPTCTLSQLQANNSFNQVEPLLTDASNGNFRPVAGSAIFSVPTAALAAFPGGDRPTTPQPAAGILTNTVLRDFSGSSRGSSNPPGAYAGPVRARVAANGYLGWNGFLGMVNILELSNSGSSPLAVTATLFDISGTAAGQRSVSIPAGGQIDLIINDISGFQTDAYGLVTLDYSGSDLRARMSYYRPARQSGEFDFAFALPLTTPSSGETFVSFNTFQPSRSSADSSFAVYNWLSIVNYDPSSAHVYTVRRFDSAGSTLNTTSVTVQPFGRVDLEAGHVNPGPNSVGLFSIASDSPSAPYSAFLVRYGPQQDGFAFAFPLSASATGATVQYVPVSTGGGAQNWVELINTLDTEANVTVSINDGNGQLLDTREIALAGHAQFHLDAALILGAANSGSARIETSSPAVLVNSMYYFFNSQGAIDSMYGSQSRAAAAGLTTGSYNLFLSMANWLKLVNPLATPTTATIQIYSASGVREVNLELPARGAADLPLHQFDLTGATADSYGVVQINGTILSQILRIKPSAAGRFDFVFPTEVN